MSTRFYKVLTVEIDMRRFAETVGVVFVAF